MDLIQRRAELDGFAGNMTRLRQAYDTLNKTFPLAWSPDSLVDVMQTGDRLSYHPETVSDELTHFHAELPKAIADVTKMKTAITPEDQKKIAKILGTNWQHSIVAHLATYQGDVASGMAQMQDVATSANEASSSKVAEDFADRIHASSLRPNAIGKIATLDSESRRCGWAA